MNGRYKESYNCSYSTEPGSLLRPRRPHPLPAGRPFPRPSLLHRLLRPKSTLSLSFRPVGSWHARNSAGRQLLRAWTRQAGQGVWGWELGAAVVTGTHAGGDSVARTDPCAQPGPRRIESQPQAPPDVRPPAPAPRPACRPPVRPALRRELPLGPWGLVLSPSPTPAPPPPPPAQLPRAGPATPEAGRSRAHVRSAYLGGGGGGLGGCYRGGCSARNGEQRRGRGRDSADGGGADPPRPCAPGLASSAPGPAPDTAQAWARVPNQLLARTLTFLRPQCPPRTRVPAGVCGHAWVLRAPGHGTGEAWG
uniref:uncharacterized protein LOC132680441 n=1 Tax=Panthera onca TaxID=9690 RepID=UPI002955C34D|nr:uncharacterized protein LOC132680441 [Panthera onca]